MNPDHIPKTRSVLSVLTSRNLPPKKWAWIGIFKPAGPLSRWVAC